MYKGYLHGCRGPSQNWMLYGSLAGAALQQQVVVGSRLQSRVAAGAQKARFPLPIPCFFLSLFRL